MNESPEQNGQVLSRLEVVGRPLINLGRLDHKEIGHVAAHSERPFGGITSGTIDLRLKLKQRAPIGTKGALEAGGHVGRERGVAIEKIREAGVADAQSLGGLLDGQALGQNVVTDVVAEVALGLDLSHRR